LFCSKKCHSVHRRYYNVKMVVDAKPRSLDRDPTTYLAGSLSRR
jgi:hypothetical protein